MSWIYVARSTVEVLANSKQLRNSVCADLSDGTVSEVRSRILRDRSAYTLLAIGSSRLLSAWSTTNSEDISTTGEQFVALWDAPGQSTISTLPDEIFGSAVERICNLAFRLWDNLPLSEAWTPKKIGDFQSIFLSGRIDDLRVAYALQALGGSTHLRIGRIHYAQSHNYAHINKRIEVPSIDPNELGLIPKMISKPLAADGIDLAPEYMEDESVTDDPDVIMNRGRGEDRHLFSMSRSVWMDKNSPLTRQQRRVINDQKCPMRIHGPGGSGKTLVLILKALDLLSKATDNEQACKVLMILHNNEVRNNVRAAIEAIDESGFLATSKEDTQYLDVETLHGWCMRELKIDTGGIDYALHPDTIASKKKQDELLEGVIEQAIVNRLEKNRNLLSADLCAHFYGPRDKLVANVRHEIAIRIKGRGMRDEQKLYVDSPLKSFVGRGENKHDRYFLFKVGEEYENQLRIAGRLDTDDVVLSMQSRLAAPLWNRQRTVSGYDYVFVDETHLFNENERRVLPYLTRGDVTNVPIIMSFDDAQSIGGRRTGDLEQVGIRNSGTRTLKYVHRSSPEIYRLAQDLIERSALVFSEFSSGDALPRMSEKDLKKCKPPALVQADGDVSVAAISLEIAKVFKSKNYPRVGIVAFDNKLLGEMAKCLQESMSEGHVLQERGDSIAGKPLPGIFIMSVENCGGLEFDAVILAGVDQGRVPPSLHNISPEGHLSVREESCKELYTALTRARYHVSFVCDRRNGPSEFLKPWIASGLLQEA